MAVDSTNRIGKKNQFHAREYFNKSLQEIKWIYGSRRPNTEVTKVHWRLWFDSRQRLRIFLFATTSRPVLGPIQPPIHWVPRSIYSGVKRPWRVADHSPPSYDQVNAWNYNSTTPYTFTAWCLTKYRMSS